MHTNDYLVIAGSTRPMRRSPAIARWVADLGDQMGDAPFRVIDLKDLGLGLDDEPGIPAKDDYVRETTRAWSALVQAAKGVVFVSPQYNWGYPAPLKNALDHLYNEWRGKPVMIVTYGQRGGGKCAHQLRQVAEGLNMRPAAIMPALKLTRAQVEANDGRVIPERDFVGDLGLVRQAFAEFGVQIEASQA